MPVQVCRLGLLEQSSTAPFFVVADTITIKCTINRIDGKQTAKEDGEEYDVETDKGTKTARMLGTTMRTDFGGKVVIPFYIGRL